MEKVAEVFTEDEINRLLEYRRRREKVMEDEIEIIEKHRKDR